MPYAAGLAPTSAAPPARVAFVDSGLGLLGYAAALRALRPDVELVLSIDPDHMPYGPRPPQEVRRLIVDSARSTLSFAPDAIVVACNTASVHGLEALRAELEPGIPVIGTVPAIRPAAAGGGPVAVWATAATTSSDYLRGLIDAFAADVDTSPIAAHGLAEAIESADFEAIDAAIEAAAAATPSRTRALVLGCTHYGLVADHIAAALRARGIRADIFDSPDAVARQTLRRLGIEPVADPIGGESVAQALGTAEPVVLLSGRRGVFPSTASSFAAGRLVLSDHLVDLTDPAQPAPPATRPAPRD